VHDSVRNQTDADRLQRDFGQRFVPLLFDVTDEKTVQAEAAKVNEHLGTDMLDGLVNNAGIEVAGPLAHLPTDHQLEVNLVGPFIVTKGVSAAPRRGSGKERDSWEDCEHQLCRWQDCRALHGRLLGIEVRTGRFL
jgi:NAD(P)-dependent dehydrogenase (short-subunit alcohol dehydrogenase family)